MPNTTENLKIAFAGESQANRKYLAYAQRAQEDGFPQIAKMFRAAAEAETIHAMGHLHSLGYVGSTVQNLKDAVHGETYEYTEMYPPMLEQAQKESHRGKTMINLAMKAEKIHASLYQKALEMAQNGTDLTHAEIYVCPICGDIEIGFRPERCPICGATSDRFQEVQ